MPAQPATATASARPERPLHGPWPPPPSWGNHWPGPARSASPATVVALLGAAVIAAVSIPLDRGGLGWLVTALAGTAALILARRLPHPEPATLPPPLTRPGTPIHRLGPARFGWSAATVALLGVGTIRSAGWLVLLCLATALLTGALATAGGRSTRAMTLAAMMAFAAPFRAVPWLTRGLGRIQVKTQNRASGVRVAATVAVSVALLVVFGALFASADPAFADLLSGGLPDLRAGTVFRWAVVFLATALILGGAAYLRAAAPDQSGVDRPETRRVARLEWAIPLGLLVLLFSVFVAVQLAVLFGGSRHVLETDGLTYANYARGGFWQLLVATGLTLAVLSGAARWAPRANRTDRVLIRVILGALAALTLVIVASALHRMQLYSDTYGLTRLRMLVALCELWFGVAFGLILIAGIRLRASWLPRAVVAAAVLGLLGLAAVNPDGLIADHNITRSEPSRRIDLHYLSTLSADAVPALEGLSDAQRYCVLPSIARSLDGRADDWRGWSFGRERARVLLAGMPRQSFGCAGQG